ncbi:hypothetical protein VTN31DRAFT_5497 [Thermomyces dupontii]|uniref:uncharacterized protein n=1 Tax=Talaromyces thermophilus TaxID=28565 RepID=UPI003742DCA9
MMTNLVIWALVAMGLCLGHPDSDADAAVSPAVRRENLRRDVTTTTIVVVDCPSGVPPALPPDASLPWPSFPVPTSLPFPNPPEETAPGNPVPAPSPDQPATGTPDLPAPSQSSGSSDASVSTSVSTSSEELQTSPQSTGHTLNTSAASTTHTNASTTESQETATSVNSNPTAPTVDLAPKDRAGTGLMAMAVTVCALVVGL